MQKKQNKNDGFTLVELVIVIAVMVILAGIVGLNVIQYIEKARKSRVLQEARAIYDQCTIAIAGMDTVKFKDGEDLDLSIALNKVDPNLGECGRVSSISCYHEYGNVKNLANVQGKAAYVDQYIAKSIVDSLPEFSANTWAKASPNGMSIAQINASADHANRFNLMCIYDANGCLYVEVYHNGYFVHYTPETKLDDVVKARGKQNDIKFTNVTTK